MHTRLAFGLLLLATPLCAAAKTADPFDQGSMRLGIILGSAGGLGTERYIIGGASFGYFVVDGLEAGLEGEHWFGGDPSISKLSPAVRFVFYMVPAIKPYVGTFYRHWFIGDPYPDADTVGGRVGAFYVSGGGSYFGLGIVHEILVSECSGDCAEAETYPELLISIAF